MKRVLIAMMMLFSVQQINAQELNLKSDELKAGIHDFKLKLEEKDKNAILPVRVIKGKSEGPVFTIMAGVHGYEYPPIIAVQELINEIDYTKLKGTIIIVPIANTASFSGRSAFYNPLDGRNLNTTFPGKENGTITEQIAYQITNKIIPISDIFLDIHAGDASEDLIPFICYYNAKDYTKQTEEAKRLSENAGYKNVVSYPYTLTKDQPALYAFKQAVQDGKIALSLESGKLGNVQKESVAEIKNAVYLMLNDQKMYSSKNLKTVNKIVNYNQQAYIKSDVQGIFYSNLKAGDDVKEGQIVGYVTDFFGKKIKEFKSPATGKVLYKIGTPPINPNETVFCIVYKE